MRVSILSIIGSKNPETARDIEFKLASAQRRGR